jgi:hypothetical protein
LSRGESFVKRGGCMGVEIIQHDMDLFHSWAVVFNQIVHANGKVLLGAPGSDFHMTPTGQRLQKHEQVVLAKPHDWKGSIVAVPMTMAWVLRSGIKRKFHAPF